MSDDDFFDSSSNSIESIISSEEEIVDVEICTHLQNDIDLVKTIYGDDSIEVKGPIVDTVDITLLLHNIPLSNQTAKAWRVNMDVPIVIQLKGISANGYLYEHPPRVEVYQPDNDVFGIRSQLTFIIGQYCKTQFASPSNYNTKYNIINEEPENNVEQELIEMGFTEIQASVVSQKCDNIQEAIQYLIENPNPRRSTRNKKQKTTFSKKTLSTNKKNDDDFKPNYLNGMLSEILRYVNYRIPTLNKYCVICDQTHLFGDGLLKPAVCRRELCAFTYQQFNIISDAELATHQEVIDLLVCMAKAAANTHRAEQILNPFPTLFDPSSAKQEIILDPDKPDYARAKNMLNKIKVPCTDDIHKDPLIFSLLQWIINSNRTHLVKLPSEYHINEMDTPFQYIMLSAAPEKENRFRELKKLHGSTFAFHGSRVENWHSILRNGLRNASGTKLQLNGAAYGHGIYLATHAATSFGYSLGALASGTNVSVSNDNDSITDDGRWICLALCEVIKSKNIKNNSSIWVVPDEDCVVTRFFFVFKDGRYSYRASQINTSDANFMNQIKKAMSCIE